MDVSVGVSVVFAEFFETFRLCVATGIYNWKPSQVAKHQRHRLLLRLRLRLRLQLRHLCGSSSGLSFLPDAVMSRKTFVATATTAEKVTANWLCNILCHILVSVRPLSRSATNISYIIYCKIISVCRGCCWLFGCFLQPFFGCFFFYY